MPSRLLTLAMAARQDQPPILPAAHNSAPDGQQPLHPAAQPRGREVGNHDHVAGGPQHNTRCLCPLALPHIN